MEAHNKTNSPVDTHQDSWKMFRRFVKHTFREEVLAIVLHNSTPRGAAVFTHERSSPYVSSLDSHSLLSYSSDIMCIAMM